MFYGPGAGGAPTASAVLGDLVTVARNRARRHARPRRVGVRRPGRAADGRDPAPATTSRSTSTTARACWPRSRPPSPSTDVSIQTVRQEGRGADAQLVVVSHDATDAQLAATVERLRGLDCVREVTSVMRVEGMANEPARPGDRGRPRGPPQPARQWRGVIEEYRAAARPDPRRPEPVTLREGGTPLVHSDWLSEADRRRRLAQGRGRQPDRLVQGPRHDRGDLGRRPRGRAGRGLRLAPATPPRRWRRTPPRPALTPIVLIPEGKIAAGKMAQAIVHGALIVMVRGNFDDCLELARELAWRLPGRAGQLGQPGPAPGPEDRGLRDRRLPRRRPRRPPAAGRQRRQHRGVLDGLRRSTPTSACATRKPRMHGFQAEGAAPLVTGEPFPDPETKATAIRIGNPASWKLAEAAAHESGGRFRAVSDAQILAAQRELAPTRRRVRRARLGRRRRRAARRPRARATRTPAAPSSSP